MMHHGFLGWGSGLVLASALAIGACGDDTGVGGSGASASTGTETTTTGTGSSTASTGSGIPVDFDCNPSDGSPVTITRTNVIDGLNAPILVKSAPDDPDRLYVVQQSGEVLIYEGGNLLPTPFIDASDLVDFDSAEQGLLGMAFHPDYKNNGRFFLHYSAKQSPHDSTIQEFHRSAGNLHIADHDPVQLVLREPTAEGNHNGGTTEFGPDGFLYIALGDGGTQGDPECDAQHTDLLLGKIMRVDVNAAPDANGFPAPPGNPDGAKYYHIGFRNPWRMSFDGCTGDLYIGDVGQNTYEEVNFITGADGPRNFGWPYREGAHDFSTPGTCPANPGNLKEPFFDYDHNEGTAVIGGYVYRSSAIPGLRGTYFFGDDGSGKIWTAVNNGDGTFTVTARDAISGGTLSSFGQDGRGNVYVVDVGSGTVDVFGAAN